MFKNLEKIRDVARDIARKYHTLSAEELDELTRILVPMKFLKGDQILGEGEVGKYMYFVNKGLVRQYYFKNGKDLTEHFSYENMMVICIESFVKQEPTRLLVEAMEPTIVFGIPHDELEELAARNHNISMLYRRIFEVALIDSQVKADMMRFETAQERYIRLFRSQPQIFQRAPLIHIASFLQMTPETLSRVRSSVAI